MKRGTRVGQAYVALAVDGTGINEEIADELDQIGPEADRAGEDAGDRFGTKFSDRFRGRMDEMREKVAARLSRDLGDAGEEAGDSAGNSLGKRMAERARTAGDRVGRILAESVSDSFADEIEARISRQFDLLENRLSQLQAGGQGGSGGGGRPPTGTPNPVSGNDPLGTPQWMKVLEAAHRMNKAFDRARHLELVQAHQMNEVFDRKRTLMLEQAYRMNAQFNAGRIGGDGRAIPGGGGSGGRDNSIGDIVGRLFGAGSRNNFLNLFGKSLGGLVKLTETFGKAAGSAFKTFIDGAKNAEQGVGFLKGGFSALLKGGEAGGGIAKAFSSIAASGPAAAVAIGVVALALSALTSVISALVAVVTAFAATITSGLVGALAVGSAGILALVAAGGLLINMFTSLTDAQSKAMKNTFEPLHELLTGIGQLMAGPVIEAFDTWAKNLTSALSLLIPLASVMGDAFARAGNILTAAFSGPGFQRLSEALTQNLPTIVRVLSRGLGDFLNGLAGTFAALMPFVTQFVRYLADVADRFSTWANSAQGQNAIADFMERALDSLNALWDATREFGGFLASVLFSEQAQASGNSLFEGLARTFQDMTRQIREWAEDGTLEQWFKDGEKLAKSLGDILKALLGAFNALSDSGVLAGVAKGFELIADAIDLASKAYEGWKNLLGLSVKPITGSINAIIHPIETLKGAPERAQKVFGAFGSFLTGQWANDMRTAGDGTTILGNRILAMSNLALQGLSNLGRAASNVFGSIAGAVSGVVGSVSGSIRNAAASAAMSTGSAALAATSQDRGGHKPEWKNPYVAWAESLIKDGPSVAQQIRNALAEVNKQVQAAIREAMAATDAGVAKDALKTASEAFLETGKSVVDTAQQALNSAAQSLASATSAAEAQRALRAVRRAQRDLKKALDEQKRLRDAARILNAQQIISPQNVERLLDGLKVQNATLADYARARERLAIQIENAQRKLEEAISLRNDFRNQIAESIKAYGSLVSAQAQTINGVAQALTADDVISNLQTRLDRIKQFQDGLRELTARGLSDAAYKQLLEAGVEGGFDTVQALLNGGQGAVQQINDLLGKIGETGDSLGQTAADKLYQAGVDAAQGLIDGLNSLDDQLEAAATRLGNRIADAVKAALGIKSPSTVLIGAMGEVGNGAVIGLDNQHGKISAAGSRFGRTIADSIAVSPEVAAYQAAQRASGVSGNGENGKGFRDLIVQTPTEDPRAVALETLNEVMGRL